MKILVTGSAGFIGGYLVDELLEQDHEVVGIDNYSKYGTVEKSYDANKSYQFVQGDVKNTDLLKELISDCDQAVAIAAIIGGISMFHTLAYDLLAENERITASTFDAAIWAFKHKKLKKINVISSSMVFENTKTFPTPEGEQLKCPPPSSTYGFQKLACEYFAKGAYEQYGLPFTIIRPFNAIGIGEKRALIEKEIPSGNITLAMSHVVPDLAQKILKGQNPLRILGLGNQIRHFTYAGDLAKGIRLCIESEKAVNEDFNLSTQKATTILELAEIMWKRLNPNEPFKYISDEPFKYDVQRRVPAVIKAHNFLRFNAKTSLDKALDEILPWIKEQIAIGGI
ncbi:UDP-glucose 4-epimerase [Candidatus Magnetoovum chiemensis]|nr:UDP-glucose 4-epimerase [Candidatus Magnetoovum chiemensis]